MKVFKTFLLILKGNIKNIGVYCMVFLAMTAGTVMIDGDNQERALNNTNIKTCIINEDGDSEIASGLQDYIAQNSNIVSVSGDKESLGDALIFREVEYIVRIPKGFSEDFLQGNATALSKIQVEASYSGAQMDQLINGYLNKWKQYQNSKFDLDQAKIRGLVQDDLETGAIINFSGNAKQESQREKVVAFYNFLAYGVLGTIMSGTVACFAAFYQKGIKRRNDCSATSGKKQLTQMILGSLVFSAVVYVLYNGVGRVLLPYESLSPMRLGMDLGLVFVFLTAILLGVLITIMIEKSQARFATVTTVSLVLAFLSGMFVPQDELSGVVKSIAKFTPTFWYLKGNNELAEMSHISSSNLDSFLKGIAIQGAFCIALLAIILVLMKYKQQEE